MQINRISQQNYAFNLQNSSQVQSQAIHSPAVSFKGAAQIRKSNFFKPVKEFFKPLTDASNRAFDKMTDNMAKYMGKLIGTKAFEKTVFAIDSKWLTCNMAAFTSVVLSSFYIKKTLENEKLDKNKRTTLAVNQGAVAVLSGALSYMTEHFTNRKVDEFIAKFLKANSNASPKLQADYANGIKAAKSIMIFGIMYRFIAPVFVTPIANKIGDNLNAKRALKENNQLNKSV